ncbi:hypothetical protein CC79DRAFT_1338615 [Sarocladium strictum]
MKTHQLSTNRSTMWLNESPDEAHEGIVNILSHIGIRYDFMSVTRVPPNTEYDEFPHTDEWMQAGGDKAQGLLVEIKQLDPDGMLRLYVVGRPAALQEADESASVRVGGNVMAARKNEVLSLEEAIELFVFYYDYNTVPDGWHLRPRDEFSYDP